MNVNFIILSKKCNKLINNFALPTYRHKLQNSLVADTDQGR